MEEDPLELSAFALNLISMSLKLTEEEKKKKIEKKRRLRRWWMISCHRNRTLQSMEIMFQEMLAEDAGEFHNFCRMSPTDFFYLLELIEPTIKKATTKWRVPIPPKVRLAIALRFLATGDSFRSLHFLFKVSSAAISHIVNEVCQALIVALKDEIKMPQTPEEWMRIEEGFQSHFPHCVGAIDGKHVLLECPIGSGSEYFNYKKNFSIVLMALVDSHYNFIFADIGAPGRISDGGVFQNSVLYQKMIKNDLGLPPDSPLPGREKPVPYVFLGDGAFALGKNLMKPFGGQLQQGSTKRLFNYRLSSTRVVVENVFGVLTSVFRIFRKPMQLQPKKATTVTMTCLYLHNFLKKREASRRFYAPPGIFDHVVNGQIVKHGTWRQNLSASSALDALPNIPRRAPMSAMDIRDEFAAYFNETS